MRSYAAFPVIALLVLLVGACARPPGVHPGTRVAEGPYASSAVTAAVARGDFEEAAVLLERQARDAAAAERALLLLQAAELRLELNQLPQVHALLATVDEALLASEGRYRKALLETRVLLVEGQTAAAAERLAALPAPPSELRAAWLKTRAAVAAADDRPLEAVEARVELEPLLADAAAREANHRAIWTLLSEAPMPLLRERMPPPPNQLGAWLELAYLVRTYRLEPTTLQAEVDLWRQRYPTHPANDVLLGEILAHYRDAARPPERIAVLLPLSGDFQAEGNAVLDGMMAAYYATRGQRPQIKVYDVGTDPGQALSAYRDAVDAGSELVVGPLTKESLVALASAGHLTAPVLALNALPGRERPTRGLYQFSLAPEDDAVAAADYAAAQGHQRALVMVPDGEWGMRVAEAFAEAFTARGGQVLETASYNPQSSDYSASIQMLLNLDASDRRARQLRGVLNRAVRAEPERRHDVDVIFLGAFPRAARLMRPQLRFFDAMDVPVIATSHAYSGSPDAADQDLDGVRFVDMPWLLHDAGADEDLGRAALQQLRESAVQLPRLYAFGIDAYRVARQLPFMRQQPLETLEGHTGVLSLDDQGRIHRRLYPARFQGGRVQPAERGQQAFGFRPPGSASGQTEGNAAW